MKNCWLQITFRLDIKGIILTMHHGFSYWLLFTQATSYSFVHQDILDHYGLVTPYDVRNCCQYWLRYWLGASTAIASSNVLPPISINPLNVPMLVFVNHTSTGIHFKWNVTLSSIFQESSGKYIWNDALKYIASFGPGLNKSMAV